MPFTSGDESWLDVLNSDANLGWWLSLLVVPLMFVTGTGGLIGLGLTAGAMWLQLFLAGSAFVHTFTVGDQLYYGTLLAQAAGAVLVLVARELEVRRRSGPPRLRLQPVRPVRLLLIAGATVIVGVSVAAVIGLKDEVPFYLPEDVYLYLVPLLLASATALVPVVLRLGAPTLAISGGGYGLLSMLLVGTPLLLWWVLVMVVGWLVARGAELIRRPALPKSAGGAGL